MHGCSEPDEPGGRKGRGEKSSPPGETEGPGLELGNPLEQQRRGMKSTGCCWGGARGVCSMQLLRAINRAEASLAVSLHHH